jgi:protein-S-isoprenylcysteine O-methyltransferase Ste14
VTDATPPGLAAYQRTRRAVLAALIFIVGFVLLFGSSTQPETTHDRIELVGFILICAGIVGRMWSILYIGGRKSIEIVTAGPYSVTRNPLYFFSSIAAAGVGAQMGSYVAAIGLAIFCAFAFHIVILREERYLGGKMGTTYAAYLNSVPRFFPNPLIYRDQARVTFRPRKLRDTFLDGLVFFAAIPFFELIETGQESGTIPVMFHLH